MNKKILEAFAEECAKLARDAAVMSTSDIKFQTTPSADMLVQQRRVVNVVCKVATKFNPRFDETRFRQACNPIIPKP